MDIIRAKEIVRTLADGVDPTTGEVLPAENVYNSPEVIRALFTILEMVDKDTKKYAQKSSLENAGMPWSEEEDEKLRGEFSVGLKLGNIAKEHGRSRGAIESRVKYLGLR